MAKQGKCESCQIRWVWKKERKLVSRGYLTDVEDVKCPTCGQDLEKTNGRLDWLDIRHLKTGLKITREGAHALTTERVN